jgi:hypothetical protein
VCGARVILLASLYTSKRITASAHDSKNARIREKISAGEVVEPT